MSVFRKLYVNDLVPTKIDGEDVLSTEWEDLRDLSQKISFETNKLNVGENLYLDSGYNLTVNGGTTTLKGNTSIQASGGQSGDLTVAGSVTVTGGLTVTGTTTTVNTTNLNVADRIITLNNGETS